VKHFEKKITDIFQNIPVVAKVLNVLGGVIHNIVVGPFFYEKHLNWEIYARFLREQLEGLEEQLEKLEDVPLNLRQGMFITFCKNYKFNNTIS
jgi:hypothetical protein